MYALMIEVALRLSRLLVVVRLQVLSPVSLYDAAAELVVIVGSCRKMV